MDTSGEIKALWRLLRERRPLVHMIPNGVSAALCADAMAAAGARPVMAGSAAETAEITAHADSFPTSHLHSFQSTPKPPHPPRTGHSLDYHPSNTHMPLPPCQKENPGNPPMKDCPDSTFSEHDKTPR